DLADADARDLCLDGLELAANLCGSLGFQVPHILMRRAAVQVDIDDGLVLRAAGSEHGSADAQRCGSQPDGADSQKVSPREAAKWLTGLVRSLRHRIPSRQEANRLTLEEAA